MEKQIADMGEADEETRDALASRELRILEEEVNTSKLSKEDFELE